MQFGGCYLHQGYTESVVELLKGILNFVIFDHSKKRQGNEAVGSSVKVTGPGATRQPQHRPAPTQASHTTTSTSSDGATATLTSNVPFESTSVVC